MGEPEAKEAIKRGWYREADGCVYDIKKQPNGSCTGCTFQNYRVCPDMARHICCTGGYILWPRK